MSVAQWTI